MPASSPALRVGQHSDPLIGECAIRSELPSIRTREARAFHDGASAESGLPTVTGFSTRWDPVRTGKTRVFTWWGYSARLWLQSSTARSPTSPVRQRPETVA